MALDKNSLLRNATLDELNLKWLEIQIDYVFFKKMGFSEGRVFERDVYYDELVLKYAKLNMRTTVDYSGMLARIGFNNISVYQKTEYLLRCFEVSPKTESWILINHRFNSSEEKSEKLAEIEKILYLNDSEYSVSKNKYGLSITILPFYGDEELKKHRLKSPTIDIDIGRIFRMDEWVLEKDDRWIMLYSKKEEKLKTSIDIMPLTRFQRNKKRIVRRKASKKH